MLLVDIYAGPSAGKSVLQADIYSALKKRGVRTEMVREVAKEWAYEKKPIGKLDQIKIFADQMHLIHEKFKQGVNVIVCDSPVFANSCYAVFYKNPIGLELRRLAAEFESDLDIFRIFVERDVSKFEAHGRYHDLKQSLELDEMLLSNLSFNCKEFVTYNPYKDNLTPLIDQIVTLDYEKGE